MQAKLVGDLHCAAMASGEQVRLALCSAAPARANSVDHILGRKGVRLGCLSVADLAAAKRKAGRQEFRAGGAMDGSIHAATSLELGVSSVDDRIARLGCDVTDDDLQHQLNAVHLC